MMGAFRILYRQARRIRSFLLLTTLLAGTAFAETIRIVSWDMQLAAPGVAQSAVGGSDTLEYAIAALNEAKPDVVILHRTRDWQMSSLVAQGLTNAQFRVLICPAFATNAISSERSQVAILSRLKAYFTWSEPWNGAGEDPSGGGFAFAGIEAGRQRLGVYAVQAPPPIASEDENIRREKWLQQWAACVQSFKGWTDNRIEAAVVSVVAGENPRVEPDLTTDRKFVQDVLSPPFQQALELGTSDHTFYSVQLPALSDPLATALLTQAPLVCDLHLDRANPAIATITGSSTFKSRLFSQEGKQRAHPLLRTVNSFLSSSTSGPALWLILSSVAALLLLIWAALGWRRTRKLKKSPSQFAGTVLRLPDGSSNTSTVVVASSLNEALGRGRGTAENAPAFVMETVSETETHPTLSSSPYEDERESLRREAYGWLKEKFVNTLIADRGELLSNQHDANSRVMAVDERLKQIEAQLKLQTELYENHIQELNQQLLASKEENRALIHAKIRQIKEEMETARRVLTEHKCRS